MQIGRPNIHFYALLLFLFSLQGYAQKTGQVGKFTAAFLPVREGGVLVFSGKQHSLSLEFKGDSIRPTDQPNYLLFGNQILQVSLVPLPNGSDGRALSSDRRQQVLKDYVVYEMDYFQKELKLDVRNLREKWVMIDSIRFICWAFDQRRSEDSSDPKVAPDYIKQVFLSAIWYDQVIDINDALLDSKDVDAALALLTRIVRTAKAYNGPLDIVTFARKIK